jgi:hypothetical protein
MLIAVQISCNISREGKTMTAGKAHGKDRNYQVSCRNILQVNGQRSLQPYSGDGVDVTFNNLGGTRGVTFDVALKDSGGSIVVAECRRRTNKVKQEDMFAFARKVELLRKHTNTKVAGLFFTKSQYQTGALRHADWSGIEVAVFGQDQTPQNFVLAYQRYDPERETRLQEVLAHVTETATATASVSAKVFRADGTVEDLGTKG